VDRDLLGAAVDCLRQASSTYLVLSSTATESAAVITGRLGHLLEASDPSVVLEKSMAGVDTEIYAVVLVRGDFDDRDFCVDVLVAQESLGFFSQGITPSNAALMRKLPKF
jgi:hypothetical protein